MSEQDASDVATVMACPNCATRFVGHYCPHCAQPARLAIPSVGRFLRDLADKLFAVQGKLPLTLRVLATQPGQLTRDYLEGRRERYLKPLNLYVAVTLLFFLLLGAVPGISVHLGVALEVTTLAQPVSRIEGHSGIAAIDQRLDRFSALPQERQHQILHDGMIRNAPRVLALLVPVFALLLALLCRGRYYGEHLLFALHFHSFAFLALIPGLVPWPQPLHDFINDLLDGLLLIYLFLALRRVYPAAVVVTLLRTFAIAVAYALAIAAAALAGVAAGLS